MELSRGALCHLMTTGRSHEIKRHGTPRRSDVQVSGLGQGGTPQAACSRVAQSRSKAAPRRPPDPHPLCHRED